MNSSTGEITLTGIHHRHNSYREEEGKEEPKPHEDPIAEAVTLTGEQMLEKMTNIVEAVEAQDDEEVMSRKRFLLRLTNALHSAGNLSFRTERYVEQVGRTFDMQVLLKMQPVAATLSFYGSTVLASDSYHFRASPGLSAFKLSALDELCSDIIEVSSPPKFESLDKRLLDIELSVAKHTWQVTALAHGCAALSGTIILFGGSWTDGGIAFFFGLAAYANGIICQWFNGMPELESFIASFFITFSVAMLHLHVFGEANCVYGQVFGSLIWLLPGLTITIALLEIYSSMILYGSARLMYGIFVAMQLGFGMSIGYRLASGGQRSSEFISEACGDPAHEAYAILLLPMLAASLAVIIDCSWSQVPGTIFTCAFGYIFTTYAGPIIPDDVTPFLSAIVVTTAARVYSSRVPHERPLVYIICSLLMLVPGGMGVKGMSNMWSGDMWSGMAFTFQMLMVGVSLAVGVFVALLPRSACRVSSSDSREVTYSASLAAHLTDSEGNLPEEIPIEMLEPEAIIELELDEGSHENTSVLLNPI